MYCKTGKTQPLNKPPPPPTQQQHCSCGINEIDPVTGYCSTMNNNPSIYVTIGTVNRLNPNDGQTRLFAGVWVHPQYMRYNNQTVPGCDTGGNDIPTGRPGTPEGSTFVCVINPYDVALIKLAQPITRYRSIPYNCDPALPCAGSRVTYVHSSMGQFLGLRTAKFACPLCYLWGDDIMRVYGLLRCCQCRCPCSMKHSLCC